MRLASPTRPSNGGLVARVISLRSSQDRRALIEENLRGWEIPWEFFDASLGSSPSRVHVSAPRQLIRLGRLLTPGEIGCAKSHIGLLLEFINNIESDWLLVLEDDVIVDKLFRFVDFTRFMSKKNIKYIRLFAKHWKPAVVLGMWSTYQILRFKSDPYGTQAYLINRNGAKSFISNIESIDMPIDDELGRFWKSGLTPYSVFPFPVLEQSMSSNRE